MEYAVLYDQNKKDLDSKFSVIQKSNSSTSDYYVYLSDLDESKAKEIANAMNNRIPDMGPDYQ